MFDNLAHLLLYTPLYSFVLNHSIFSDFYESRRKRYYETKEQFLATDILVPATMKNAAKCDT